MPVKSVLQWVLSFVYRRYVCVHAIARGAGRSGGGRRVHERAAGGTQQTVAAPGVALPPLINLINRFNICPSHRAQDTHSAQLGFAHACHVMHQVEWSGVEWSGVEWSGVINTYMLSILRGVLHTQYIVNI